MLPLNVISRYTDVILAVYLWDEPETSDPIALDCIGQAARQVRAAHPAIHREVTFLAASLVPGATNWLIPDGVDWIGYDHYDPPPGYFVPVGTGVYPGSVLRGPTESPAGTQPPLLPGPAGQGGLRPLPGGWERLPAASPDTSFQAQAAYGTRADREIALAENDPDYVMIMPFLYQSGFDSADPNHNEMVGVNELPMVKEYYRGVGKHVTSTTAPMRPAFPTPIAASNQVAGGEVGNAFDFDPATGWNAGGYVPQWISASFADPLVITSLSLTPLQSPAGMVHHVFSGTRLDGSTVSIGSYSGPLADGQTLTDRQRCASWRIDLADGHDRREPLVGPAECRISDYRLDARLRVPGRRAARQRIDQRRPECDRRRSDHVLDPSAHRAQSTGAQCDS